MTRIIRGGVERPTGPLVVTIVTLTTEGVRGTNQCSGRLLHFDEVFMRINGRILRASDLRERRVLLALGCDPIVGLRVPRSQNPYAIARRIRRMSVAPLVDFNELRAIIRRPPVPTPDVDVPFPAQGLDGPLSHP